MALRVLILGGTSEGRQLAELLASEPGYAAVLSFAGRTASLERPRVPHRVGGFGGVQGLVGYLQSERCQALVDATHPFARQMSAHAVRAAELTATPLLRLECPEWRRVEGDRWTVVSDMAEAPAALGARPRRVFLSIGRLELGPFLSAPQHEYLIRAIDTFVPELPRARLISARGPFELRVERDLLEREGIEIVVSKNSGTPATYAKIEAARQLGLPLVMVARPRLPVAATASSFEAALDWLRALHGASIERRGV